jgi:two-component system, cell cycle sensor histidine kinase and response regulator CckA
VTVLLGDVGDRMILLVEDEPLVRDVARAFLEYGGYEVLAAGTAEDALTVAAAHCGAIEALVTDVQLPGMDGSRLAGELTARLPHLKIVFMSGNISDTISHDVLREPRRVFISKPFGRSTLLSVVSDLIGAAPTR